MAYVQRSQVTAKIPASVLNDALDDNRDGKEDDGALDGVIAVASQEVDGYLSGLFSVPFAEPVPAKVKAAALIFVFEMLYQRRGIKPEDNPYSGQAQYYREHLQKVGNREMPLDASTEKKFAPGAAITTCSPINFTMS